MMHSSPMPLKTALDMTKRLHHELAKHMTPEQKRDMSRIEHLIEEAQHHHMTSLLRAKKEASHAQPQPQAAPAAKKGFWAKG